MKKFLTIMSVSLCIASCSSSQREVDEREGARVLADARKECKAKHYDAARDSIMSLRKNHPLAMAARKQGILLLDSIELFAACDSLDALNERAQQQYMECLGHPDAPLKLDSATYVDEHERLEVKVQFFQRKLQEDLKKKDEKGRND